MRIILTEAELRKILADAERDALHAVNNQMQRERAWLTRILRDVASERAAAFPAAVQGERIIV